MRSRGGRVLLPALGLAVLLALDPVLAGCASDAASSAPTGIDELVIPTPSVDPGDFVGSITNRYLPLTRGTRWTYTVSSQAPGEDGPMTVTAERDPVVVDGVRTTAVVTEGAGVNTTDYYAQDRSGNVWWFGRSGSWQAGVDGAEAGLAMPAAIRLGDGWREAYLKGVVEDHAEILATDDSFKVLDTSHSHVVDLITGSTLDPGTSHEESYVAGIGLVRSYSVSGLARLVELTSGPVKLAPGES